MKNRIPTKPNRYAVYDDAHNFLRHEYHERADEPTEVGTAINKATLLSDETAAKLGLTGDPTVNDAFIKMDARFTEQLIALCDGRCVIVHVKFQDGSPAAGFVVTGIRSLSGVALVTDARGEVVGAAQTDSTTIQIASPYADVSSTVFTISTPISNTQIVAEAPVDTTNFIKITSSQTVMFSDFLKKLDITVVGGGGGGGGVDSKIVGAGGGGGGYVAVRENVLFISNIAVPINVGAGGAGGSRRNSGAAGGSSGILGVTAAGGQGGRDAVNGAGGAGNGAGGAGGGANWGDGNPYNTYPGLAGSVAGYSSATATIVYGGGGGGGGSTGSRSGAGGAGYGGKGGDYEGNTSGQAGSNGFGGGGGGGGGPNGDGGNGGPGCVALRMVH